MGRPMQGQVTGLLLDEVWISIWTQRKAIRFNVGDLHDLIYSFGSSLCVSCENLKAGRPIGRLFQKSIMVVGQMCNQWK